MGLRWNRWMSIFALTVAQHSMISPVLTLMAVHGHALHAGNFLWTMMSMTVILIKGWHGSATSAVRF